MSFDRTTRVGDRIRQVLAELLQTEVRDPELGFVTLTDVELSSDLRHGKVFVSVLGDDKEAPLRALKRAAPFLQRHLGRRARLRYVPHLRFELDTSLDRGLRIDSLLQDSGPGEPEDGSS